MADITRWEPFAELSDLRQRLDRLFGDLAPSGRPRVPALDVIEKEGELTVRVDIPGFKAEETKIEVEDGVLTISGEHEETTEEKDESYVRRERRHGSFSRSLPLPSGVDAEQIKASTKDGVLEVSVPLPKREEKKAIEITPEAS